MATAGPIPLRAANLASIGGLGVPVPRYEREVLVPRILHVGVGRRWPFRTVSSNETT